MKGENSVKPMYIFASRMRSFWVLAPITLVLWLSVHFNRAADGLYKLYPLIVFSALAIVFAIVYLFRAIQISYAEIKYIGRFSSRDSATINEGKTIVIDLLPKKKVSIQLYGNEGYNPEIKWLQNDDGTPEDICLFRGKSYGGANDARRILLYFGVDVQDIEDFITSDADPRNYENVTVSSLTYLEHRQIRIRMNTTI